MENRNIDLLLWGVTGWTGIHLAEYLLKNYSSTDETDRRIVWGVAARNQEKYEKIKELLSSEYESFPNFASAEEVNNFLNSLPTFFVSNDDEEKIGEVVKQVRVVCTVVGPYMRYGEKLLHQCIINNTHYTDLTGEAGWIDQMKEKYGEEGRANGTWIIPSCGFDTVPSNIGTIACLKELKAMGASDEDEVFVKSSLVGYEANNRDPKNKEQTTGGGGSMQTGLDVISGKGVPDSKVKLPSNPLFPVFDRDMKKLGLPSYRTFFVMAPGNQRNVYLSKELLSDFPENFEYTESMLTKSYASGLVVPIGIGAMLGVLKVPGVSSLVKYMLPKTSQVPVKLNAAAYEAGLVDWICVGEAKGLKEKVAVRMIFPDEGGWTETAKMMVEAALTMVLDGGVEELKKKTGIHGGILTSACLGERYIERLRNKQVKVEVTKF
eukprot:maker-scaffold_36-snap-gene-2.5-mRNA-1 protein AED:0.04 eAED:0.04 QI:282/1/1/1/1/1/2/389/434